MKCLSEIEEHFVFSFFSSFFEAVRAAKREVVVRGIGACVAHSIFLDDVGVAVAGAVAVAVAVRHVANSSTGFAIDSRRNAKNSFEIRLYMSLTAIEVHKKRLVVAVGVAGVGSVRSTIFFRFGKNIIPFAVLVYLRVR